MTAPLHSTPHSQLPASQTAPVAEFRCLYTPDIRKKQKKWQDGYLKFHTFNNRVMVYDQARNFLGDTYYKDSNELHEGDELTLDKGVMVEVADAMGVTQTDLTPLFEKKPKEAPPPPSAPPRRFQPPSQVARPQVAPPNPARTNSQLRHKSLNTLLGTPKGPIGKSVPVKSPYEARQEKEKENGWAADRAAKRQKTTHKSTSSVTLRLSSPVYEETPAPKKNLPKSSDAKKARMPPKPIPRGAPVINLDPELDTNNVIAHISSDISLPSSPPRVTKAAPQSTVTPAPPTSTPVAERPAMQTPKIPRGKVPVSSVKALETPRVQVPPSSPPVSASNRLTNVDFAITPVVQPTPAQEPVERPPRQSAPPQSPPRNPKAKSLRLSAGVKRGILMCQTLLPPRPRDVREPRSIEAKSDALKSSTVPRRVPSPITEVIEVVGSTRHKPSAPNAKRKSTMDAANTSKRTKSVQLLPDAPLHTFENDPEVIHGLMDQQLIVSPVSMGTPSPGRTLVPDSPKQVVSKPKTAKTTARNACKLSPLKNLSSKPGGATSSPAQSPTTTEPQRKPAQDSQPASISSSPTASVVELSKIPDKAVSPALSAVSDSHSRTASVSPHKLAALSTGGFRKGTRRATAQPTLPASDKPVTAPRNETVELPPHPLRVNKKGPVMTTTELAAMLSEPKKKAKPTSDPIQDDGAATDKSPNRSFRRVRSENDAPIPSTSEDWEKRNLPKPTAMETPLAEVVEPPAVVAKKTLGGLAALVKKTDPRKKFIRTQSLNVDTTVSLVANVDLPSPVADKDVGPWSTEAFDLFDWRPPRSGKIGT